MVERLKAPGPERQPPTMSKRPTKLLKTCPVLECRGKAIPQLDIKGEVQRVYCEKCGLSATTISDWQSILRPSNSVKAIADELRRDFHSAAAANGLAVKLVQITSRLDSLAKEECERSHCDTDECAWVGAIDGIAEVLEMEEYSFATEVLEAVRRRSRVILRTGAILVRMTCPRCGGEVEPRQDAFACVKCNAYIGGSDGLKVSPKPVHLSIEAPVCMECQGTGLSGNDPNTPCPNGCQEPSK